MKHPRPILIAGPTASGKSSLALKLARECNGVIINADALQVYNCYDVLTARPSVVDHETVPHMLYGHQPNAHGYSVGAWLGEIKNILQEIENTAIIVGGTGLYFKSLLEGLAYIPLPDQKIRDEIIAEFEAEGLAHIQARLKAIDPTLYARVDIQNPRRVMRGLEVFEQTGRTLSSWQDDTAPPILNSDECTKYVIMPEVETTNARIAKRFEQMMELGALEEVQAQMPFDPTLPANKALGAREIAAFIDGTMTKDEAIAKSITLTCQYAKRQRSWFRSNMSTWDFQDKPIL